MMMIVVLAVVVIVLVSLCWVTSSSVYSCRSDSGNSSGSNTINMTALSVRGTSIMLMYCLGIYVSTSTSSIMMMMVVVLTVVRVVLAYTSTSNG